MGGYADGGRFLHSMSFDVDATGKPFRMMGVSNEAHLGNMSVTSSGNGGTLIGMPVDLAICQPNIQFVPVPGEHYRAHFVAYKKTCGLIVLTDSGAPAPGYKRLPACYIPNAQSPAHISRIEEQARNDPAPYDEAAREVY